MWMSCFTRRASRGCGFHGQMDLRRITRLNIVATQRLLEAATAHPLKRLVYASSSSVYGAAERFPTLETDLPAPMSPYGVTKLAAEQLCSLYHHNFGVPTVSLRYFTVYGPRQRPDMAMCRLIDSAVNGAEFVMFGDGSQIRTSRTSMTSRRPTFLLRQRLRPSARCSISAVGPPPRCSMSWML